MLLRARIVLPVSAPPIENGAVLVSENRVAAVGAWRDLAARARPAAVDLGQVILLPGLINSHCHLDYTDMTGLPPQKQFPDWIKGLLALKAAASYTDYAEAWLRGAGMLSRTGVTTVADVEAVPELLPEVWSSTPLRVFSFLELTGVKSHRQPAEILHEAAAKLKSLASARGSAGLSPHALYSTPPDLLRQTAALARRRKWRVTMHVAESLAESEMYTGRRGPMFDWLKRQRDMSDCQHRTRAATACWGRIFWLYTPTISTTPTSRRWPNPVPAWCIARKVTPISGTRPFPSKSCTTPASTFVWAPTAWPAC
jgi:cytosine/adenosine deaminase-related metal-dependent hydrolase